MKRLFLLIPVILMPAMSFAGEDAPRRQIVGIQDDFNRKGLISDQGGRKKAFYVMKKWYEGK